MKKEYLKIRIKGCKEITLRGDKEAIQQICILLVRGAGEMYLDQEEKKGRTRVEVAAAMADRAHLAQRLYELGEMDSIQCDLSDC